MEQSDRDKLYRKVDVSEIDNPFEEGLSYFTNQKDNGWLEEYTPGSPSVEEIEKVLDDHAKNSDYDEVPDVGILEGDFYTVAKSIHDLLPEERPVVTDVNSDKINEASHNRFRDFFTPEDDPEMWDLGFHHGAKWALSLQGKQGEDTAQERLHEARSLLIESIQSLPSSSEYYISPKLQRELTQIYELSLQIAAGLTK